MSTLTPEGAIQEAIAGLVTGTEARIASAGWIKREMQAWIDAGNTQLVSGLTARGQIRNRALTGTPTPSFSLSLLSGLTPELFAGSGTPTFTRATAAAHTDFEGIVRQVPAGCVRFQGSRFVFNAIPSAGSGSASLAVAANKTVTVTAGTWVFSMGAEATGTGVATFTGTATGSSGTLTADATRRTAATFTITVGGTVIITASVQALANLQLEDVTTRTNKNPSEYVPSVSTANADSGAIGCRFFSYLNGNSII